SRLCVVPHIRAPSVGRLWETLRGLAKRLGVIAGEGREVTRLLAGDFMHSRRNLGSFAAPIMGVVLEKAHYLPWRKPSLLERACERVRWHLKKGHVTPDCSPESFSHLAVRDGGRSCNRVSLVLMAGFGERRRGHRRDIAHVHSAHARVANRR